MKGIGGLILRNVKGGNTEYYFKVRDQYFGPYQFASIAIINKIKEEGRLER